MPTEVSSPLTRTPAADLKLGRLDRYAITPTELAWDFAHLKRLQSQDNLLMAAIHHIARAQVQGQGTQGGAQGNGAETAAERARALEAMVNQTITIARDAQLAKK